MSTLSSSFSEDERRLMPRLDFQERVSRIRPHGLGLSVDLYTPDLYDLVEAVKAGGLKLDYLEIFKAWDGGLKAIRSQWPDLPLTYHAEGLWVTQPDLPDVYPLESELRATASQLAITEASWVTHECASKQIAGYAFGTYVPPLFTARSADVTAENIRLVQERVDALLDHVKGCRPLFLLETPPLTYFGVGDLDLAAFFLAITERVGCGVVLDIGHLWTMYRYADVWRRASVSVFLDDFLERFPLERVVQIHLAGLGPHEKVPAAPRSFLTAEPPLWPGEPPLWIDAHEQPIPAILFDMLQQVLEHPRLQNLRGVALEVDNKPVRRSVEEFRRFTERFGATVSRCLERSFRMASAPTARGPRPMSQERSGPSALAEQKRQDVAEQYSRYARAVSGLSDEMPAPTWSSHGLELYRRSYLPYEISTWGGDLVQMFPNTLRSLGPSGLVLEGFFAFWFREARWSGERYDFFLLKLDRFVSYVEEIAPDCLAIARDEATHLREAYAAACR